MSRTTIAIPAETNDGLGSQRSNHFGHSQYFTVLELDNGQVKSTKMLTNIAHDAGGCMQPVGLLAENGVEALMVGGIGRGPFARLHQQGIRVFFADLAQYPNMQATVDAFVANKLPLLHPDQLCTNNGTCHH